MIPYIYTTILYSRFRASNFYNATKLLSSSLFPSLAFTRSSSSPTVSPSYYTPSPLRLTSSPLADSPDYSRSDRTTNSAPTSTNSPPSAPDSTALESYPCTTSHLDICSDETFRIRTAPAAPTPGTSPKTSTEERRCHLPRANLAVRKSSPTTRTSYRPSAAMPNIPVIKICNINDVRAASACQ